MAELHEVTQLLHLLSLGLQHGSTLSPQRRLTALERLKVLGRSAQNAELISDTESIRILGTIGLSGQADDASREALRCLANTLLLKPPARQTLVDLHFAGEVAERLKSEQDDDEFLCSRILFLLTYETSLDFMELVEHNELDASINQVPFPMIGLFMHDLSVSANWLRALSGIVELQLMRRLPTKRVELLVKSWLSPNFIPCVVSIMQILTDQSPLPRPPLQPPINHLVNALLNFDYTTSAQNALFPEADPSRNVARLVEVLDYATLEYPTPTLDTVAMPLITIIRRAYEAAPATVRTSLQHLLLPTDEDRERPLGQGDSLSSRLLRLSTSTQTPNIKESISSLFFELSDKDVDGFVSNIGYGYASGYLASHNLAIPELPSAASESSIEQATSAEEHLMSGSNSGIGARNINLVTGQFLDQERIKDGAAMTEQEKLREAERLFVLFERLNQTGVVTVQNPLQAAVDSGRFKELD